MAERSADGLTDALTASLRVCRPLASAMQVLSLLQLLGGVLVLVLLGLSLSVGSPLDSSRVVIGLAGGLCLGLGLLTYWPAAAFRSAAAPADLARALGRLRWLYVVQAAVGLAGLAAAVSLVYLRGGFDLILPR